MNDILLLVYYAFLFFLGFIVFSWAIGIVQAIAILGWELILWIWSGVNAVNEFTLDVINAISRFGRKH